MPHFVPSQSTWIRRALLAGMAATGLFAIALGAASAPAPSPGHVEPDDEFLWEIFRELLRLTYERLNQMEAPDGPGSPPEWIVAIADSYQVNGPPEPFTEQERQQIIQTIKSTDQLVLYYENELEPLQSLSIRGVLRDAYAHVGGDPSELGD